MRAQELPLSCGAACARELLRRQGKELSEGDIRGLALYSDGVDGALGGIFAVPLGRALSALSGQKWQGGSLDRDPWQIPDYLKTKSPLIVMLGQHWVIVDSYDDHSLTILDPEPDSPGGQFATEGSLDYAAFFALFRRGHFQLVERKAIDG